jgi:hypothetical protein
MLQETRHRHNRLAVQPRLSRSIQMLTINRAPPQRETAPWCSCALQNAKMIAESPA